MAAPALARCASSPLLLGLLALVLVAAVLGLHRWLGADAGAGEPGQPSQTIATAGARAAPAPGGGAPSGVKVPGNAASVPQNMRPRQVPADLGVALELARSASVAPPHGPPGGQASWQGMTPQDAAKVFEAAVRPDSSAPATVNPFAHP